MLFKNMIAEEAELGENSFFIVGSDGQGKCAEIPRYLMNQAFERNPLNVMFVLVYGITI